MKTLGDTLNSSSQRFHSTGKGNTGRPPNKACRYCCRKKVYPEKCDGGGKWRYPSSQECFDCVMVFDGIFDQIRRHKSMKYQHPLSFPLTIFDITKNVMVGEYSTKEKVQYAIDRYQQQSSSSSATQENKNKTRKVDMLVIHYPDYRDFRDCFTNVYS
jgi:hypothetical protein